MSKIGGWSCDATEELTIGGRGGTNSKLGFHGMGGRSNVSHRSVGSIPHGRGYLDQR